MYFIKKGGLIIEKTKVECRHCSGSGKCTGVDGGSCDSCLSAGAFLKYGFVDHKRKTVNCAICRGKGYLLE